MDVEPAVFGLEADLAEVRLDLVDFWSVEDARRCFAFGLPWELVLDARRFRRVDFDGVDDRFDCFAFAARAEDFCSGFLLPESRVFLRFGFALFDDSADERREA